MEPANPMNCMQMDDDEDDGDDQISLNDLRLMYAKLLEIHRKDIATECDLRERIKELKASSIEKKAEKMRNQVREIKDKIEATKEENKILSTFSLDGFAENQEKVKNLLSEPIDIINNDVTRLSEKTTIFSDFVLNSKISSACQTDLTFPPSFSCFFSTSSQEDKPFNAQDAFIEIQLAHKRQLEERLNYLKKQMWFDGPDVMLVKFDDYEKMIAKSSSRRRRRLKRNQNQFDCYLDISDNLEKRPCLESPSPSPSSPSSHGNNKVDEVQLFFTNSPKQTNGQGSQDQSD
ncbi:uncharacterized protein LOC107362413 [Tetranychus urticae]|uniref:Uncharacterized protein n=1 Tax=Tetranychus urticae TaxID=32264 RepID=T1KBN2_TETUR|nr:uncharacterized protein LOC107362413 [Tetranychus urticae]XP_015784961.1 uncharacterized protein LOC107362413 [Tetranychus urticae]XP_015784963.1 uncharacterized protein LOC107362413 [Tetranychus urticae]XP_025016703.1 uncharacterized protein LOC107362413 [Tetranychus urticae]